MIRRLLLASLLCLPGTPRAADPGPPPVQGAARCPVCGMHPAQSPRWMAQIVFNDQTASSFDTPVDLFRFLNNMAIFDRRHQATDVGAVWVTDYGNRVWVDARGAFFVHGSRIRGPMNDANLPAFASRESAEAIARIEGGRVLGYGDITRELIKGLAGAHRH